LHAIGALIREGVGRYRIDPHLAFHSTLDDREDAATKSFRSSRARPPEIGPGRSWGPLQEAA
jgi:hypothetical protein